MTALREVVPCLVQHTLIETNARQTSYGPEIKQKGDDTVRRFDVQRRHKGISVLHLFVQLIALFALLRRPNACRIWRGGGSRRLALELYLLSIPGQWRLRLEVIFEANIMHYPVYVIGKERDRMRRMSILR